MRDFHSATLKPGCLLIIHVPFGQGVCVQHETLTARNFLGLFTPIHTATTFTLCKNYARGQEIDKEIVCCTGRVGRGKMKKSVLSPNVVTAFLAGLLLGNFNINLVLGFLAGGIAATILEQNRPGSLPNVRDVWQGLRSKWRESQRRGKP